LEGYYRRQLILQINEVEVYLLRVSGFVVMTYK
jgi:hypothetical protein